MHLSYIFLVGVALITLPFVAIKAQYDDDTTPRKVRLEDLEEEQDENQQQHEQLQQFTQQQLPLLESPKPNQRRPALPPPPPPRHPAYYQSSSQQENAQKFTNPPPLSVRPLEQHVTPPPRRPIPTDSDYETASANRYSLGVRPFGNGIASDAGPENNDDVRREPQQSQNDVITYSHDAPLLQQLLDRQQLSGGYALKHEPAAFVLVPPFGDAGENGNSAAHNHRLEAASTSVALPAPPTYHLRHPLPPPPNKPFGRYLPSEPAPSSSLQYAAAAGVQYVNNNNLSDEDDDAPPSTASGGAIEYAREQHFSPNRPQIEYGAPAQVHFRRPTFPQLLQSNQLAYAPQRSEAGTLSAGAVNIPYPPSFISITTRRPQHYNVAPVGVPPLSGRGALYGRDYEELSQLEPVPDFFSNRRPKSLLDSYIPSWVVAKMLQQPRHGTGFNSLVYTGATPFNRNYKRELSQKTERKANFEKKIVKKSLNSQSERDEMLMTA